MGQPMSNPMGEGVGLRLDGLWWYWGEAGIGDRRPGPAILPGAGTLEIMNPATMNVTPAVAGCSQ